MKKIAVYRYAQLVCTGLILLQIGGCTLAQFNDLIQTIFLGITAAGSYAILRNI